MITIILAHPWHGSFNKAILDKITGALDRDEKEYTVIDLNKDNFNPVVTEQDLALYNKGKSADPLVEKYQEILKKTEKVIFIFPIWWHTMPAILKGFFDKVMLLDFGFNYTNGWTPLLDIKDSLIITTSANLTERFRDSIEGEFVSNMLHTVGITNAIWLNKDNVVSATDEERKLFLLNLEKYL